MRWYEPGARFVVLLLLVFAFQGWSAPRAEERDVRLYTNADLERFPDLPDSRVEAAKPSTEEWGFVTDYLQRQYSRIDADRAHALQRERAEAEVELIRTRANRRTYGLPLYWNRFGVWRRVPHRPPREGAIGRMRRALLPDGSIRPLHAGPTRAQIDYAIASRRSGADAFPSNSRAASSGGRRR
jgi:hypothetical protein